MLKYLIGMLNYKRVSQINYMENQKPSIGRIVVYNHPGSADGMHGRKQSPAVVQRVNEDGTVELFVMSTYGGIFFNHNVKQVDDTNIDSRWEWPSRV